MLEHTQSVLHAESDRQAASEIEVLRAAAPGENTIAVGEDVVAGSTVIAAGRRIRPAEIGGLMALGITQLNVAAKPIIGLISSGDEVIEPTKRPGPGQVRDVNAYTLAALIEKYGGVPVRYGIVPDEKLTLQRVAAKALQECQAVIITAGSSASTRDMTAEVIDALGMPGVLVHGINTRPGKPTILGVCNGKAVVGLPGNPVSALVNAYLFIAPLIERLLGVSEGSVRASVPARLTVNLASQAGREDWWPVHLVHAPNSSLSSNAAWNAEPIFSKSNLIFSLAAADGLLRIAPDATGLAAGEMVEVFLL
jgi:molybdopterin molybdotransferase